MKRKLIIIATLYIFICANANPQIITPKPIQNNNNIPEKEFHKLYSKTKNLYDSGKSDNMMPNALKLMDIAKRIENDSFKTVSCRMLGNCFYLKNDYVSAIEKFLQGISIAENKPNLYHLLPQLYNNLGFTYTKLDLNDYALHYLKIAKSYAQKYPTKRSSSYIYENLASTFLTTEKEFSLDSASNYLELASTSNINRNPNKKGKYEENYIQSSIFLDYGIYYGSLYFQKTNIAHRITNLTLARRNYLRAISFSDSTGDYKHLSNATGEYADFLLEKFAFDEKYSTLDSSKFYALNSLKISRKHNFTDGIIKSADLMRHISEQNGIKYESEANHYARIASDARASISLHNKPNRLIEITATEKIKDRDATEHSEEILHEKKSLLQLLFIAMAIISASIAYLIVSQSIIVSKKFIDEFGTVGLLIGFEFLNLLVHHLLGGFKHVYDSPAAMLLILVGVAAILAPIHHRLENWIKIELVGKNRKKRIIFSENTLKEEGILPKPRRRLPNKK